MRSVLKKNYKGFTLVEVMVSIVISAIIVAGLLKFTRITFQAYRNAEERAIRKNLLDYYYYIASSPATRKSSQEHNLDLNGHVRDLPGKRKVDAQLSNIPSLITEVPNNLVLMRLDTVRERPLIPKDGLYLKREGSVCDPDCFAANKWFWKVKAKWAPLSNGRFEFYISVEPNPKFSFLTKVGRLTRKASLEGQILIDSTAPNITTNNFVVKGTKKGDGKEKLLIRMNFQFSKTIRKCTVTCSPDPLQYSGKNKCNKLSEPPYAARPTIKTITTCRFALPQGLSFSAFSQLRILDKRTRAIALVSLRSWSKFPAGQRVGNLTFTYLTQNTFELKAKGRHVLVDREQPPEIVRTEPETCTRVCVGGYNKYGTCAFAGWEKDCDGGGEIRIPQPALWRTSPNTETSIKNTGFLIYGIY